VIIDDLAAGKYISLATFKKDGTRVATPVWVTREGDHLYVITEANSGKAKRLRNSPRAQVAACDMRGTVTFKHDSLRFSWYRIKPGAPVDQHYVGTHFSNSHLLCADDNLRRALGRLGRNDEFELTGYLINAHIMLDGQKREWNTSMIRTDGGPGACETIYVTSLKHDGKLYGAVTEPAGNDQ